MAKRILWYIKAYDSLDINFNLSTGIAYSNDDCRFQLDCDLADLSINCRLYLVGIACSNDDCRFKLDCDSDGHQSITWSYLGYGRNNPQSPFLMARQSTKLLLTPKPSLVGSDRYLMTLECCFQRHYEFSSIIADLWSFPIRFSIYRTSKITKIPSICRKW